MHDKAIITCFLRIFQSEKPKDWSKEVFDSL